jgi:hypothetical protein
LLKNMDFLDVSNLLGQGFFADRVVRVLSKTGPIDSNDETVFKRVRTFLTKILQGQEQVSAERLSHNTLETIDAYQKALVIFNKVLLPESEEMTASRFKELMGRMEHEIEEILERKSVLAEAKITLEFFKCVQRLTIDETSDYLSRRAVLKWPKPTAFYRF